MSNLRSFRRVQNSLGFTSWSKLRNVDLWNEGEFAFRLPAYHRRQTEARGDRLPKTHVRPTAITITKRAELTREAETGRLDVSLRNQESRLGACKTHAVKGTWHKEEAGGGTQRSLGS